jgi:hypothetical protein
MKTQGCLTGGGLCGKRIVLVGGGLWHSNGVEKRLGRGNPLRGTDVYDFAFDADGR